MLRVGGFRLDKSLQAGRVAAHAVHGAEHFRAGAEHHKIVRAGEDVELALDVLQRLGQVVLRRKGRGEHRHRLDLDLIGQEFHRPGENGRPAAVTGEVDRRAGAGGELLDDQIGGLAGFDLVLVVSLKGDNAGFAFGPVEDMKIGVEAAGGEAGNQRVIADALAADAIEMQEPGARHLFGRGLSRHGHQPDQKCGHQQPAAKTLNDQSTNEHQRYPKNTRPYNNIGKQTVCITI